MRKILIFILTILLYSFSYGQTAININTSQTTDSLNWVCVPGISVGPITSHTSEKDLIKIYGKENVARDTIDLGEGFFVIGTLLFPNTKNEIQITWTDTVNFISPNWIYIRKPNSNWKTNTNIGIGTSLKELEKINGKEFIILGFGWDYSGTVSNWNGGKLAVNYTTATDEGFIVRLDERGEVELSNSEQEEILGDKEILTSNKTLQKLNPKVYELIIIFKK